LFSETEVSVSKLTCSAQTLDAQNLVPAFIKIDVQGFEYQVLKGAINTLKKSEPVLLLENPGQDPRILDLLISLNYKEYYCLDGLLHEGRGLGDNSLFITNARLAWSYQSYK
jgi:hypothetical protein